VGATVSGVPTVVTDEVLDMPHSQANVDDEGSARSSGAPVFTIPPRLLAAVEHPMIIKDLDKGLKTLGRAHSLRPVSSSCVNKRGGSLTYLIGRKLN
jgi:hypothetical protein